MKIERVVVFGHKPGTYRGAGGGVLRTTHTHSYIHGGYKRAFEYLGYETHWLDHKSKDLNNFPTKGTLFFTEDQVDQKIPISDKSGYVTHHSSKQIYSELSLKRLNLCNYVADLNTNESFNYPGNTVEKIDATTFIDVKSKALYQPWATNLLPYEIDPEFVVSRARHPKKINYVGTIGHDNILPFMKEFRKASMHRGVKVKVYSGVSDERAQKLVSESLISVDVRGDWHRERGYVPCRIWKNLSYGLHVGSNSPLLDLVFQGRITISRTPIELLEKTLAATNSATRRQLQENMIWVRDNHTFVNRAKSCLDAFQDLC
jgi:hypothetical protein